MQLRKLRLGGRGSYGLMPECQEQSWPPPWAWCSSGRPVVQLVLPMPRSGQAAARGSQAVGTVSQGSRGWKRGLLGRAGEGQQLGAGRGVGGEWGVQSGRRPALIGTRWLHWEPSLVH